MDNTPLNIVLADDDESDRLLFSEALNELKHKTTVHTVNDGAELMEYLFDEHTVLPYILFLDLNMPKKSGLECLKEIKNDDRLKSIVVAIYSTSSSEKDIDETYINGANIYIKKPNDYNTLKAVLEKVLSAAYVYIEPPFNIANFMFRI